LVRRRGVPPASVGQGPARAARPGRGARAAQAVRLRTLAPRDAERDAPRPRRRATAHAGAPRDPFRGRDRDAVSNRVRKGDGDALHLAPRPHAGLGAGIAPLRVAARLLPGASPAPQDVVRAAVAPGLSFPGRSVRPGVLAPARGGPRREAQRGAARVAPGRRLPAHSVSDPLAHAAARRGVVPGPLPAAVPGWNRP